MTLLQFISTIAMPISAVALAACTRLPSWACQLTGLVVAALCILWFG